jgi:transposase
LSHRSTYDLNSAASPWQNNSTGSSGSPARSGPASSTESQISTLRSIAARIRFLITQTADLDAELATLLPQHAAGPALLAEPGVGPVVAAQFLVSWSHRGRVRSEAAFASLAGVAPLEASSGQRTRHRLSRAGDRDLNRALHTVAITRLRCHDESRAYETKRAAQGKTHRDIRRSLKRALARRLYRRIQAATRPAAAFNGLAHAA